ncbi:MAG: gliding motility protein GldM [Chlorobi bacterium]|nr:gliding motility protein GldM [Chlorobiota bacterium]
MAHGKETPRQKMIGMMYLVLTALLALNVSKHAVEAFKVVDESLTETTRNYMVRNNEFYQDFEQKAATNPIKAGPWRNLAHEVRNRANEMFDYIQALKIEIIKTAEGENTDAIDGNKVIVENVTKIDDNNVPSQILIGAQQNGKAYDLRAAIDDYREFLLGIVGNKNENIVNSIKNSLNTEDTTDAGGEKVTWEIHNFHTLPLIAVITILSKLQSDIRNTEGMVLNYLYSQIEASDFKFNKLEPTVIANSNYIMSGSDYEAEVFIAATDSTQKPEVLIGKYETATTADGTVEYRMVGNYETLPIDQKGRGVYKKTVSATGEHEWGGLIRMKNPEGSYISFPFTANYTVAVPNVVVSPTAMNVFYVGVDNPVDVSVPGVASDKISVSMTNGTIRKGRVKKFRGSYIVRPKTPGVLAKVRVTAEINGKPRSFPSIDFRVKRVPDPVAKVAGKKGGNIKKAILRAQQVVIAEMENFDFDLTFTVTSFRVSIVDKGFVIDEISNSNRLTPTQKGLINRLSRNQQVVFQDIKAVGPDGSTRQLPALVFKIQ